MKFTTDFASLFSSQDGPQMADINFFNLGIFTTARSEMNKR